jgi:cell division septum initiation protein DivIVA
MNEAKRRPGSTRIADRLVRTFGGFDRTKAELPRWEGPADPPYDAEGDGPPWSNETEERFPIVPDGYDPEAVDRYLCRLEAELDELRRRGSQPNAIAAELKKLGEQTSAILQVAHDQAAETTRRAQTEADRCLADAAANAVAMSESAKRKLRQIDTDTETLWRERTKLIDDTRALAAELAKVAEAAALRFPPESEPAAPGPAPAEAAAGAQTAAAAQTAAPAQAPVSGQTPPATAAAAAPPDLPADHRGGGFAAPSFKAPAAPMTEPVPDQGSLRVSRWSGEQTPAS